MSVLGQSFKSVQRAAKERASKTKLSVWLDESKPGTWLASFAAASAQYMGDGPTPEQAIESASRSFVNASKRGL